MCKVFFEFPILTESEKGFIHLQNPVMSAFPEEFFELIFYKNNMTQVLLPPLKQIRVKRKKPRALMRVRDFRSISFIPLS